MNEFIDPTKIDAVYDDTLDLVDEKDYDDKVESGVDVYQIQGTPGEGEAYMMNVGKVTTFHTAILIDEYDLSPRLLGRLYSYIFTKEQLQNPTENTWLPMIRLQILKKSKNKTVDVASFVFSFHTYVHINEKKQLSEYVSTKENKVKLKGFFSIKFHHGKKVQHLEQFEKFPGHKMMCEKLVSYAMDPDNKLIIHKLSIIKTDIS